MPTVIKKLDAGSFQLKDQVVSHQPRDQGGQGRQEPFVRGAGGGGRSFGGGGRLRLRQGEGSSAGHPEGNRVGQEEPVQVNLTQTSIPHLVLGRYGSGKVLLKPAPEGTGVIAGGAVRAVMTSAGVQNVLTKSIGTTNPHNVIKATFDALKQLKNREALRIMRGKTLRNCKVKSRELRTVTPTSGT